MAVAAETDVAVWIEIGTGVGRGVITASRTGVARTSAIGIRVGCGVAADAGTDVVVRTEVGTGVGWGVFADIRTGVGNRSERKLAIGGVMEPPTSGVLEGLGTCVTAA